MTTTAHQYTLLRLIGIFGASFTLHWLITPLSHSNASTAAYVWAWGQVVAGTLLAIWAHRRLTALATLKDRPAP